MRLFRWLGSSFRAPFHFGCAVAVGLYLLVTLLLFSVVADFLSAADSVKNVLGAVFLVLWLAAGLTALRFAWRVNKPKSQKGRG